MSTARTSKNVEQLNAKYRKLSPMERIVQLFNDFDPEEVLLTSSFGTTSIYMLYLFSQIRPKHKVYFIDTTYHFNETLRYKKVLQKKLGLNLVDLMPEAWENEFTQKDMTWLKDPDFCCQINKVNPLEKVKEKHKLWVSGLRRDQSDFRSSKEIFEEQDGMIKFYPVLDVSKDELIQFLKEHELPPHPLFSKGYDSIGCKHCTVKGNERSGRWSGKAKTECGLHRPVEVLSKAS